MIFVPDPLPRAGRFALRDDGGSDTLDMFTGPPPQRQTVPVRFLSISEALPTLLSGQTSWAAATLAGLNLIARGRIRPTVTAEGYGCWRIGPLDAGEVRHLQALAAALPPSEYAQVLPHSWPAVRVPSPMVLIRQWWDALADTLPRTSAGKGPFSGDLPVKTRLSQPDPSPRTELMLTLPETADAPFTVQARLRSSLDPSLTIGATELWSAPKIVTSRFGPDPFATLLTSLRRGARIWPPLAAILQQAEPHPIEVPDDTVPQLLDAHAFLTSAGIDTFLPAEMLGETLRITATATPAPSSGPAFILSELFHFQWKSGLDDEPLTSEELAQLAEAKRPLVRLRGRWVKVDAEVLRKLLRRKPISGITALAATLSESVDIEGERFDFSPTAPLLALRDKLENFPPVPIPTGLHATLRPYQSRGLDWLAAMVQSGLGGCLADDMGLGKTIQVIALHLHLLSDGRGPTLVVCPTSLLGNWEREIRRFAPSVPVRRYHGGDRHLTNVAANEIVLVTYGLIRTDASDLTTVPWGLIVADEAQFVKNPLSTTARQLRTLTAPARLALSGTPVENHLTDLWSLLDWTTPGLLGTLDHFQTTFAVPIERHRSPQATTRLASLLRPFILRRKKTDPQIAPELPAKTETDRIVPLTAEQATLYQAVVIQSLLEIGEATGLARRALIFKMLTALKQICNHPAQYLRETGPLPGRSGKLTALDDLLEVILAEGESVLVFSQYVQMCKLIEKHLAVAGVETLFLSGQTTDRQEVVDAFQSGRAPVLLASLRAGGVGLNLTKATHVIHFDRWWNPAVEDQATDRAHRIGQEYPVQVHRLITEGTIEDRIATLLHSKRALAESVIDERWLTELTTTDLADMVRLGQRP